MSSCGAWRLLGSGWETTDFNCTLIRPNGFGCMVLLVLRLYHFYFWMGLLFLKYTQCTTWFSCLMSRRQVVARRVSEQLHVVCQLWPFLDCKYLRPPTQALVISWLDYCNTFYMGHYFRRVIGSFHWNRMQSCGQFLGPLGWSMLHHCSVSCPGCQFVTG